jgi:hypothetical protein
MTLTEIERQEKERRMKREKARLRRIYRDIGRDRLRGLDSLIGQTAFMGVIVEDLQRHMTEHGATVEWHNGPDQSGRKRTPEAKLYLAFMGLYRAATGFLDDLLPQYE